MPVLEKSLTLHFNSVSPLSAGVSLMSEYFSSAALVGDIAPNIPDSSVWRDTRTRCFIHSVLFLCA